MSSTSSLPTYSEITAALKKTPARYDASQIHGLMCGLICATAGKNSSAWEKVLDIKNESAQFELLKQLYESSYHQMSEFSFEFSLLLPQDKIKINKRAEALGLWCQGFLTGLEQGKIKIKSRSNDEMSETLNDLIEISQVTYDDTVADDEDEAAYFELVEYVRLAALMIYHELRKPVDSGEKNSLLH